MVKPLVIEPTPGARIREARKAAGMSADDLAYQLGLTANTVYRWERDEHAPSVGKLRLIAAHTGKPLSFFLDGEQAA